MALKMAITYKGIELPDAYYKITGVDYTDSGTKNEQGVKLYNVYYQVNSYTNPTKEYDIDQVIYQTIDIEDNIGIGAGYTYLKTLPYFATAIDC